MYLICKESKSYISDIKLIHEKLKRTLNGSKSEFN